MKTWVRKSLNVGVLSAGFLLAAGGAAHANWSTASNAGAVTGNQVGATAQAPVSVNNNAIGVHGFAQANGGGGAAAASASSAGAGAMSTGQNGGAASGNQVGATAQAPLTVSGNSIALLGASSTSGSGGAASASTGGNGGATAASSVGAMSTGQNAGALTGNQANAVVQAPLTVSNNSIGILGFAQTTGGGAGGSAAGTATGGAGAQTTGLNAGVASGDQVGALLQAPVNANCNSIAILGSAQAACGTGSGTSTGGYGGGQSAGG